MLFVHLVTNIGDFFVLEMMRMTIMMVTKGADDDDGVCGVGVDCGNCESSELHMVSRAEHKQHKVRHRRYHRSEDI